MELVDIAVLEAAALWRKGSSPFSPTKVRVGSTPTSRTIYAPKQKRRSRGEDARTQIRSYTRIYSFNYHLLALIIVSGYNQVCGFAAKDLVKINEGEVKSDFS